jgi:hypothetical protein
MTTDSLDQTPAPEAPAQPGGLKAKVGEVGLKVYMKAPPKAQNAMLNGFMKAQPVAAKAKRYAKPALIGTGAVLVLRRARRRKG